MKSVRYFTLNFSGFTTAACEKQGYLRLIAGDHVFYTDKRYFNDPSLFDHLTINQPLHLGVRRPDNGSYWIHWLSDGETLLEPTTGKALGPAAAEYQPADAHRRSYPAHDEHLRMGKVRLRHYRDTGLHRVVNRPLRATVPPGAKMHPAMRDLLAKMAQAPAAATFPLPAFNIHTGRVAPPAPVGRRRRRDYGANPPPVGEAFYASPAGTLCRPDGKN